MIGSNKEVNKDFFPECYRYDEDELNEIPNSPAMLGRME